MIRNPAPQTQQLCWLLASPEGDLRTLLREILALTVEVAGGGTAGTLAFSHPNSDLFLLETFPSKVASASPPAAWNHGWWMSNRRRLLATADNTLLPQELGSPPVARWPNTRSVFRLALLADEEAGMLQLESSQRSDLPEYQREELLQLGRMANLLIQRQLLREHAAHHGFSLGFVGASPAFLEHERELKLVARGKGSVLITGERGTGKELAAYAVHYFSSRRQGPFVPVNSAALTESLFADELFGHERGAFTGAEDRRRGALLAADGGTLFLDEIGEMRPQVQAALLRFLENGELRPIGSDRHRRVDVRIVTATNRDLEELVSSGAFRADVLDRLNAFQLRVPPLRERLDDIRLLSSYFMKQACEESERRQRLSNTSLCRECRCGAPVACHQTTLHQALESHTFPGNIRELRNVIARLALLVPNDALTSNHVAPYIRSETGNEGGAGADLRLDEAIRRHIRQVLAREDQNKSAAARALGIPLTTLINKMKRLGMMT